MRTRRLNNEFNIVSSIDKLIMNLSLLKNGNSPSSEELEKGLHLIESLFFLPDHPKEKSTEEKIGFSSVKEKKYIHFEKISIKDYKNSLEKAKGSLKKIVIQSTDFDQKEIEGIQELLLKISLPIWKEQVSILKPNQFKLIEL